MHSHQGVRGSPNNQAVRVGRRAAVCICSSAPPQAGVLDAVFAKVEGLPRPFVTTRDVTHAVQHQHTPDMLRSLQVGLVSAHSHS